MAYPVEAKELYASAKQIQLWARREITAILGALQDSATPSKAACVGDGLYPFCENAVMLALPLESKNKLVCKALAQSEFFNCKPLSYVSLLSHECSLQLFKSYLNSGKPLMTNL